MRPTLALAVLGLFTVALTACAAEQGDETDASEGAYSGADSKSERGHAYYGTISDPSGKGLEGITVKVGCPNLEAENPFISRPTDDTGSYSVLPPKAGGCQARLSDSKRTGRPFMLMASTDAVRDDWTVDATLTPVNIAAKRLLPNP